MARILLSIIGFALAACSASALNSKDEADPTLPPPLPTIVTTPSLASWVAQRILEYREFRPAEPGESAHDALRLALEIMPHDAALEAAQSGSVALVVAGHGPPEGWFAAPVGVEGIAVVVHPRNPVRDLDLHYLRGLFSGFTGDWQAILPSDGEVQPVIPLPGDEIRILLENSILEGRQPALTSMLGPSPQALASLVAEHEGAIGLLPESQLNGTVRAVSIDGVPLTKDNLLEGLYPLQLELVAFAPQEPSGAARDWLVWVQGERATSAP